MNTPDPKSELRKLGTGEPIDHDLLHEQMDEDRLDKLLAGFPKPIEGDSTPQSPPS